MPDWTQEYYIRPESDEANEIIAMYLKQYGDVEEFKRNMDIPGYTGRQPVYAVPKSIVDIIEKTHSLRNMYKAFVQRIEHGKIYRHRSPEQIEAAKNRRARKIQKRSRPSASPA